MDRKYPQEMLDAITGGQKVVNERGLDILVKPIPDDGRPGVMDPRLYASVAPMTKGVKGFVAKRMMKKMGGGEVDAQQMRKMMNGIKSIPITAGVATRRAAVKHGGVEVPIRIYTPETPAGGPQPVFYYIHGGGFAAGHPDVVEEMCKLVVEKTGCVSVQPDYRLAPEHPYPAGLDDCYAVLEWIHAHAGEFGGDGEKICISGDSAGGNLATVCAMRSRDEQKNLVKVQALLYPTVNMAGVEDEEFRFSMDEFEMAPEHRKAIEMMVGMMAGSAGGGQGNAGLGGLLGVPDAAIPYLSPYLGDLANTPPCIIVYGEYDFLRIENEAYARKLKQAGVEVKAVRYRGLSHGFADQVGVTPQAEDCLAEIGDFMLKHLAGK